VLFDPGSVPAIVDALLLAVRRPEVITAPLTRAASNLARFSWDRAAASFVATYRAAAGLSLNAAQQAVFDEAASG
jgi:hypothetical protein